MIILDFINEVSCEFMCMNCLLTFPKREKSCVSVILKSMDCWLAYISKKKKKKKKNEENFGLIIFVTK